MPGLNLTPQSTSTEPSDAAPSAGASSDAVALIRLEREATARAIKNNGAIRARISDAATFTEAWANTAAWTGTGVVAGGRVGSTSSLQRTAPTAPRWVARTTLHTTGQTGVSAYFGVVLAGGTQYVGIGQNNASLNAYVIRTTGIPAASVVTPRALPALPAGDYLCTLVKDETHLSLTIQPSGGAGQAVYGARVPLSALPSAIGTIYVTTTVADASPTAVNFGPVVIHEEFAVPPAASRTVGGVPLFGAGRPLVHYRQGDNGYGRAISLPGDLDSRVPAPLVLHAHPSLSGTAVTPWSDARWANVLSALEGAGYVLLSSDGGPGITPGGTQDQYGNQAAVDDAAELIRWARQRVQSDSAFLLGVSMGNYTVQNLLAQRAVGGIAAAAAISGGADLRVGLTNPTYRQPLLTAYGAADDADFAVKAAGHNPIENQGWQFRGVPQKFYSGSADTLAPLDSQVYPLRDKLLPYGEFSVTGGAVGHMDASLFQGADLVAFFNRYR